MSLTIDLTPEQEARLNAAAASSGLRPNQLVQQLLLEHLSPPPNEAEQTPRDQRDHIEVEAAELADWIEQQGIDHWWAVDGDPLLGGRMNLPAPGDELAAQLRKIGCRLEVVYPEGWDEPPRKEGAPRTLEDFIVVDNGWGRVLQLRWKMDGAEDWLLLEDVETTEGERRDAEELAAERTR